MLSETLTREEYCRLRDTLRELICCLEEFGVTCSRMDGVCLAFDGPSAVLLLNYCQKRRAWIVDVTAPPEDDPPRPASPARMSMPRRTLQVAGRSARAKPRRLRKMNFRNYQPEEEECHTGLFWFFVEELFAFVGAISAQMREIYSIAEHLTAKASSVFNTKAIDRPFSDAPSIPELDRLFRIQDFRNDSEGQARERELLSR